VATLGGAGRVPVAPGTAGSALTAVGLWLLPPGPLLLLAVLAVVTAAGIWAGGRVERVLGRKDPGLIVVDEAAGMILTVAFLPRSPAVLAAGFLLFRVLDVLKPPPAGRSQALGGGLGVVADDLWAGLYACLVLHAARAVLGWPA
jgi:phosphatidylglycerophosphatase A